MKLFLSTTLVFLVSMVFHGDGVQAAASAASFDGVEYDVVILLNGGKVLPTGETCTDKEWDSIGKAIDASPGNPGNGGRSLRAMSLYCRRVCRGFPAGMCWRSGTGCENRRRRNLKSSPKANVRIQKSSSNNVNGNEDNARVLTKDPTCSARIATLTAELDQVEAQVSADCQKVLQANRDFTCYEVEKQPVCAVTGFSLWNADTDTLAIANFDQVTDKSFCKSSFAFNIEALTDNCVDTVQLDMTGPKGYFEDKTEFAAPYFLFGNSGKMVFGSQVEVGTYTLSAYPDEDTSLTEMLTFEVKNC